MNSRERVQKAINHQEADRVPIAFGGGHDSIHRNGEKKLYEYLGFDNAEIVIQDYFQQIVYPDERLLELFGSDTLPLYPKAPSGYTFEIKEEMDRYYYYDHFGTKLVCPKNGGLYFDLFDCALKDYTLDELKAWKMPDPLDPARIDGLREKAKNLYENTDKAIILYSPYWGVFEQIYALRGIEQMYMDFGLNLPAIEILAQKILDFYLEYWPYCLKAVGEYVQVVQIGDDLGGQNGPLFNPEIYRSVFKDKHRQLINCIKKHTNAKVYYHGCGCMTEYIPDLIEVGVDILNPVQVQAKGMDSAFLKREYGRDLTFWGGGANPVVLSTGSVKDVIEEVKRRVLDFKPGGGFVFASIHNLQGDAPAENTIAFFETCLKYGKYE